MIVDTIAHAFVGSADAAAVRLVMDFQTFSAAVEGLLTRVLFPFKEGA